jgi:cysteine desulfurase
MSLENYFDNAATTPVDDRVVDRMMSFLKESPGNAHSLHMWGLEAAEAVEQARTQVAKLIGADDPQQVIFTSGATESNNWFLDNHPETWVSPYEHSSLYERAHRIGAGEGRRSHMAVNNETGTIWDRSWLGTGLNHSDLTQAVGKIRTNVDGLDYASGSAHKLHGPKGIGFLYYRDQPLSPLMVGGDQEFGQRAGTVNVPGIVGFGEACLIADAELELNLRRAIDHRAIVLDELRQVSDWQIHGGDLCSPYILNIGFAGVQGETVVVELDSHGFGISSGAACSARSTEPSPVLTAFGIDPEFVRGAVRISFGSTNTNESSAKLGQTLSKIVENLRTI